MSEQKTGVVGLLKKVRFYHLSPSGLVRIMCHLLSGYRLCKKHAARFRDYVPASINSMTTAWNLSCASLSPMRTIIDAGANCSQMTKLLQIIYPNPKVLSFEPNPACHPIGDVHSLALSDVNGESTLYVAKDDYGSSVDVPRPDCVSEIKVQTRRFDSMGIDINSLPKPILLKIDVEGYELKVLKGFGEMLRSVDALLVEVPNDRDDSKQYDPVELYAYLKEFGFNNSKALFSWFNGAQPPEYMDVVFTRQAAK